ncbi:MAG: hypothetical protein J6Z34_05080 [Clostridia bacterium]|nr:hypothetical protein [Clostridia bacterium]
MELNYVSNGNFGEAIITVPEEDVEKVTAALDLISKMLCLPLDCAVDKDSREIRVFLEDYYEFITLRNKLYDHCDVA